MFRFYLTILLNIHRIPFCLIKMIYYAKHPEKYDEPTRYALGCKIARMVQRTSRIKTTGYGTENLPKEGGYLIFPNHQGRYDMISIITCHEKPCTFIMAEERSHMPITSQMCDLLQAKRMMRSDLKQSLKVIFDVAEEVKNGRRYVIFPEGGYEHDHIDNKMGEFKSGCFKTALKSKAPIVPVALIDSYKAYEGVSYKKVFTETHFLNPIYFEEYQGMSTHEIADLVKGRIQEAIDSIMAARNSATSV